MKLDLMREWLDKKMKKIEVCMDPWPHIIIDDFFLEFEKSTHGWKINQVEPTGADVDRVMLEKDPFPVNFVELLDLFPKTREYKKLGKFVHYAVTKEGLHHPIHEDAPFKIMSAVLYMDPEENAGTNLYRTKDCTEPAKTIEWKQNRLLIFCGLDGITWHDYKATSTRRTLNWFLVDPTAVQNPEYKEAIIE